jgi:hypothetical protein
MQMEVVYIFGVIPAVLAGKFIYIKSKNRSHKKNFKYFSKIKNHFYGYQKRKN